jgi:hypothetical protein
MKRMERYVYNCIRYNNNEPELMVLRIEGQPIVVKDYGNDVVIVCSETFGVRFL